MKLLKTLLLLFCLVTSSFLFAQKSAIYTSGFKDYQKALTLYNNKQYKAAQSLFDDIKYDTTDEVLKSDCSYYIANCAVRLNQKNADDLIGNTNGSKDKHCLAKKGEFYLVYLAYTNTTTLDLSGEKGKYKVYWFNAKTGGELIQTSIKSVKAGSKVDLGEAPKGGDDWLIIIK